MNLFIKNYNFKIIMSELKKDNLNNIKLFQNIEKHDAFSKYSIELNRLFGDRTFEKFYYNLVMNKKFKDDNFLKIFEKNKLNYKPYNNFNLTKYQNYLTELEKGEENNEIKRNKFRNKFKFFKKEQKDDYSKTESKSNSKEKYIPSVPDIGRYNPNYNSIRKNQRNIIFSRNKFNIRLQKNTTEEKKKIFTSPSQPNINNRNNFNTLNTLNRKNKNKSQIFLTFNSKSKNNGLNLNSTNHALRFSFYSKRKPLINESTIYSNHSNSNPNIFQNNIKGLVEFNKMSTNLKINSFIPKQTKIPPLGFYEPKYDFVQTKSPEITIKRNPKITKKMKLKKILYEYNVPLQYELITNLNL